MVVEETCVPLIWFLFHFPITMNIFFEFLPVICEHPVGFVEKDISRCWIFPNFCSFQWFHTVQAVYTQPLGIYQLFRLNSSYKCPFAPILCKYDLLSYFSLQVQYLTPLIFWPSFQLSGRYEDTVMNLKLVWLFCCMIRDETPSPFSTTHKKIMLSAFWILTFLFEL